MPLITKLSSGRIFQDDFDDTTLNPIWQVSPTDPSRYSVHESKEGYLRLKHGDTPLYFLMDMPNRDFVFEIKNDYLPITQDDTGGIVVYRDTNARMELIEYFDAAVGASVNYTHMRIIRRGDVYSGYGSKDGGYVWEIIGTGNADNMNKIGLVLNYQQVAESADFDVDFVRIYGDSKIVVKNLSPGAVVELIDSLGNTRGTAVCKQGSDYVYLDMTTLPAPLQGHLKVSYGGVSEVSDEGEIWGGDVYWYGLALEVYRNGTLLPKDKETDLGYMIDGKIDITLTIKNPGAYPVPNITVRPAKHFDYMGDTWVKVAPHQGTGHGTFGNDVYIGMLNPGESRDIWVRISKSYVSPYSYVGLHKFLIEVEN